ncbi:nuclear transport factor 2 family protein [Galbibacter mesophilus]|uniref:nuclear transport factor 2 family protein n=1 Tax=Galbibacter mesophilus TaxID=379069 RepID=UPI00191EFBD1|nr:nuclear transport factor 2 family protein [Galbibacter mesophilus]MCM5663085.1 nuclear transport factor 2 family protein [Galbibacter mesophilus]
MKNYKILFLFLISFHFGISQNSAEKEVENTIENFFDAFHKQDTVALRKLASSEIIMQTIATSEEGESIVKTQTFNGFLKSIASIPKENSFKEELLGYEIKIDGSLAHAWTSYKFWYNEKFSHCGANSFQLVKQKGAWKIVYVIDTRRKTDCK